MKNVQKRQELGKRAEEIALEFLEDKGLTFLEKNWRSGHREIDIIMKSLNERGGMILHIVEVRSLREPAVRQPFETVGFEKQRAVIAAARSFIFNYNLDCETQFDIVSVTFGKDGVKINYFPDAFKQTWR